MHRYVLRTLFILIIVTTAGGCALPKDKPATPSEAEKKIAAFCLKEGPLAIVTRRMGNTLWIYAPLKFAIFDMRPAADGDSPERKVQPLALLSLQAEYAQRYFRFNYDIIPDVMSGEPVTYGSTYTEEYTKKRHLIYQAIQESLFSAEDTATEKMPEFIVILAADITRGLATRSTLYLKDLKESLTEAIPSDEYYMRELNEIVGKESLINDTTGRGVPYARVGWTYFLTEQIKNRIKYKFTGSDFPPKKDPTGIIAAIAANTLKLYPFTDYDGVALYALRPNLLKDDGTVVLLAAKERQELILDKEKLKSYLEKSNGEETGKLTTIRFELPQPPTAEAPAKKTDVKAK